MYKKLLVCFYQAGFFDAGFIALSSVENMDNCEDKERLLNIFKYGLVCTDEELLDEFENSELEDLDSFLNLLVDKFESKDLEFFTDKNFYPASVLDEDGDFYLDDTGTIREVFKSIFKESDGIDEYENTIKFDKYKKYDKEKVLKISGCLKEY